MRYLGVDDVESTRRRSSVRHQSLDASAAFSILSMDVGVHEDVLSLIS